MKYRNSQRNLKAVKKNSQKRKSSAKLKWKQSLKSGEVYFAQRSKGAKKEEAKQIKEEEEQKKEDE